MRIFVLCTGRCGSTTFARACRFINNYTVGHETNMGVVGPARLAYPPRHIEVDNRLSWFTGALAQRYQADARYVHLTRARDATAESFLRRWNTGIIKAFARGVLHNGASGNRMTICRQYVDTVNANIAEFLRGEQYHVPLRVRLEHAKQDFQQFWAAISATGDLDAALSEWDTKYNAS